MCDPAAFYREGADLIEPGRFTFCTATDGNHGRGVAWTARRLGQKAAVFVPRDTVRARIGAIAAEGAGVTVVDDPENSKYPLATDCAGKFETFVGRIREDESIENGINLWVVSDNILKGAALNAVQIAETFIADYK